MENLFMLLAATTENSTKHVELNLAAHEMLHEIQNPCTECQ